MPKLAEVLPKDLFQALLKASFYISNQSGSHVRLHHPDGRRATLAIHTKSLPKETFAALLRQVQISRGEIKELL